MPAANALVLAALLAAAWYGLPALLKPPLLAANRATAGLSEKTVSVGPHRIHYLDNGNGSGQGSDKGVPVLLLHGIFAEKDHWVDFARALPGQHRGKGQGGMFDFHGTLHSVVCGRKATGKGTAKLAGLGYASR